MSTANVVGQDAAAAEIEHALRTERNAIASVRAEIENALDGLALASGQQWQSAAQRAYAARLDELRRLVQATLGQLASALAALDSVIARVVAGR